MKELTIVVGLPYSKIITYVTENFSNGQIISKYGIRKAMPYTKIDQNDSVLYLITEVMVRSSMTIGRPICVAEDALDIETILIWKKIAIEHDYKIKVLIYDLPVEECYYNQDDQKKEMLSHFLKINKKFDELKEILQMKHQKIVDDVEVVKPSMEDKQDEVLQC